MLNRFVILISLFLFSCSSYLIQAEEIKSQNLKCGASSDAEFYKKNGLFILNDKEFNYKLRLIDKNLNQKEFNFLYISKPRSSGGYVLGVERITKKKDKHQIYLKENKPPQGSSNIAVITATYCFLKIKKLNKVEVFIK